MSASVVMAACAGALAGAGAGELAPDGVRAGGRALRRLRADDGPAPDGLGRLAPAAAVAGLLLLALGAPTAALLVGGGPGALHALLRARAARRRRAITLGAPLVARSVADALDAGHGVRRALAEAAWASGLDGPAADELRRVAARLQAGDPLPAALDAWRARTDEPAHRTIIAGLLLHGEAGGELADVLREGAAALERARRATAEAESAIVQARAAARIVGGIPALIMGGAVVLAPGAVRAITGEPLGALLVVLAVVLQLAAVVAVRRLTVGLAR